jgi:hypothetical protein
MRELRTLLRIEAFTVLDGLSLRVVGTCQGHCGSGGRHEGDAVSALITVDDVEREGWATALVGTLVAVSRDFPDLLEYVHH